MEKQIQETEDAALTAAKEMLLGMLAPLSAVDRNVLLTLLLKATE